jgi:hypothetical protein
MSSSLPPHPAPTEPKPAAAAAAAKAAFVVKVKNPYLKRKESAQTSNEAQPCSKRKFMNKYPSIGEAVSCINADERWKRYRSSAGDYSSASSNPVYLVPSLHAQHYNRGNKAGGAIRLENDITELSGEGGSGKTQVCLSAILDCIRMKALVRARHKTE